MKANTYKHSEKVLAKMRGRVFSEEHKYNLSIARVCRSHSEETKEKLRKPRKRYDNCPVCNKPQVSGQHIYYCRNSI